jgi:O-antigen/teichoic acid export membrane protein
VAPSLRRSPAHGRAGAIVRRGSNGQERHSGLSSPPPSGLSATAGQQPGRLDLLAFTRSAGILSLSTLANLIRSLITTKVLAVTLGTSTVGLLSQLLNFSSLVLTVVALGLTSSVAKTVAESQAESVRFGRVAGTALTLSLVSSLSLVSLLAPFSSQISQALTGDPRYGLLVFLTLAALPFYNVAGVLAYILQGLSDIKRLTAANVGTVLATLLLMVPAAFFFGLLGVVVAIFLASAVQALLFVGAGLRLLAARGWRLDTLQFSVADARVLLGYGAILLAGAIGIWGSTLLVRTLTVQRLGTNANGLYQVPYALSVQYITVFMTWMSAYVFPKVVAESDSGRLSRLLNSVLRANLFLMVPMLIVVIALREPLIRIFFSESFAPAAGLIPIQAFGDYARVVGWSFGASLFAKGHPRAHLTNILAQSIAWVGLTAVGLPRLGIDAIVVGYALSYALWPVLMYAMARHWLKVRIEGRSLLLVLVGAAGLSIALLLPWPVGLALAVLIPAGIYLQDRRLTQFG